MTIQTSEIFRKNNHLILQQFSISLAVILECKRLMLSKAIKSTFYAYQQFEPKSSLIDGRYMTSDDKD